MPEIQRFIVVVALDAHARKYHDLAFARGAFRAAARCPFRCSDLENVPQETPRPFDPAGLLAAATADARNSHRGI